MDDENGERGKEIGTTLFDNEFDLMQRAIRKRFGTLHRKQATFIREALMAYSRIVLGESVPGDVVGQMPNGDDRTRQIVREELRSLLSTAALQGLETPKKDSAE